jgi:superfamily II DNA or RNA helicase
MEDDMTSLLERVRRFLTPVQILNLPLEFHLGIDDQGRHTASVSYTIDGETKVIEDVTSLWQYGRFTVERPGKKYVVPVEDQDMLLALHSVCTETRPTGEMVFDFSPPVLRHLRSKSAVSESASSEEYEISEEPLEIGVNLDYDPGSGVSVETGYRMPDSPDLIPEPELEVTPDGGYARVGKQFVPLPKQVSDEAQKWLQKVRDFIPTDQIPRFFKRDFVLLKSEFQAVLTESAAKLEVVPLPASPRVHVSGEEKGWLDFQLDYHVGDAQIPFETIWQCRGQHFRTDAHTFVEVPEETPEHVKHQLTVLGPLEIETGYRVPVAQFASLEDFIEHIGGEREVDDAYEQFLEDLEGFEADSDFRLPPAAEQDLLDASIELRPYQRAGIHWLTWLIEYHLHGLLADDMGLGKTIQAAAALRWARQRDENRLHSLVVCPKSVIKHWSREIRKCDPNLRIYEYIGTNRNRDWWYQSYPGVAISTYATVARDVELISKVPLFFLILDESTKIKNPQTQRAQAVKSLNAVHRIALSGTPVENRPAELWSVFDFLMQSHLGTYGTFQRLFETPILEGDQSAAERLGERVGPFMLRRLKEEVADDLPEKVAMEEWVELTEEQRGLYVAIQSRDAEPVRQSLLQGSQINYPNILAILTKLKQVCDHPALVTGHQNPILGRSEKFDLILERIEDVLDRGELVVLFSQYLDMLDLFESVLEQRELSSIRLDGSVPMHIRQRRIDRLNDRRAQVALCSLQAVGHGINLIAANHVIHVDRWWNPAIEDQATDRLHRIGQKKTVFVHHVQTSDTLEEKIAALQESKRGISNRILSAADRDQLTWTREELLELLKPLDE